MRSVSVNYFLFLKSSVVKNLFLIFCLMGAGVACQIKEDDPDELVVSLKEAEGSGPFYAGKGLLSANRPDSELAPLYEEVTGLPEELDSLIAVGQWEADFVQWIYQGYHNQLIDSTLAYRWLDDLKTEDTLKYTRELIDGQVAIAFGANALGQKVVIIDEDNDEDFADEEIFVFTIEDSLTLMQEPGPAQDRIAVFRATYDRYDGERVVEDEVTLQIFPFFSDRFGVGTLGYQKGKVAVNGKNYFLSVSNEFMGTSFEPDYLEVVVEDSFPQEYTEKYPPDSVLAYQEMLTLGGELYQITDVTPDGNQLTLQKHLKDQPWHGTQLGALAYSIDTATISDEPYQMPNGKVTLVDFWGTWCSPCVREIPFLKDAQAFFAGDQFEIVGVANDDLAKLKTFVKDHQIDWPQIHQGRDNQEIIERYRINAFPTTFLVDQEGKVVGKNAVLRGHQLIETLTDVLNVPPNTLQQKINQGNVLVTLPGQEEENWTISGDFTEDQMIPLYRVENQWQRGFDLTPGTYSYTLKSLNQASETREGTFIIKNSGGSTEIRLSSSENVAD